MIDRKITDAEEPKPIVPVIRMLEKISRDEELALRYGKTLDMMANHINNNSSISLNQVEAGTRAKLLAVYANHAFNGGNKQDYLITQLLASLKEDLASLQERSVISMLSAFIQLD